MLRWRRAGEQPDERTVSEASGETPDPLLDYIQVVERLRDGVVLINREWVVGWLNEAARGLLTAPANPIGRRLLEVVRDHRIETLAQQAAAAAEELMTEITLPVSGRSLRVRAFPLAGAGGMCLLLEETTRMRYLETVRQQFVANLSHELRTPLAGLDLAAQTLAGQLPADQSLAMFMDRILEESQRLAAIVQNLGQLAAIDAEQIRVEHSPFSVSGLLEENAVRFKARAAAAGLVLRVEPLDHELLAFGDRAKTDQALQSLVDNALKFTSAGEVVLSAVPIGGMVEIAVRDTGVGIPAADLPRIFERFYKVDRARGGQPGSGLGLSIARHLVELQGGSLVAESEPGSGTIMRLRLPVPPLNPALTGA
ncbi:MAG TPA: ATP-binding protein [Candidatus Limnocylindrales bacterium]|nr:ATP-binding protein [Candidatus Limnocylindrales bacterium]